MFALTMSMLDECIPFSRPHFPIAWAESAVRTHIRDSQHCPRNFRNRLEFPEPFGMSRKKALHQCAGGECGCAACALTSNSETLSDLRNLNSITCPLDPATHKRLDSGHRKIIWMANGSSSVPSIERVRGRSNIFAVFNLYRICNVPALLSQNLIEPSWCPVMITSK